MSETKIKLAAALPKGTLNGLAEVGLADKLAQRVIEGAVPGPAVAILLYDVKKVDVDPDSGDRTVTLKVRRVQPVHDTDNLKAVEEMLFDEYSVEHGPVVPFEVDKLSREAFADVPRSVSEVDEREAREKDAMSPADELRRHLHRVHGREDAITMTDGEAEEQHRKDHEGDELPEGLQHDVDWIGWTRADLEAAEAESEDSQGGLDFDASKATEISVIDSDESAFAALDAGIEDGPDYDDMRH